MKGLIRKPGRGRTDRYINSISEQLVPNKSAPSSVKHWYLAGYIAPSTSHILK